MLRCLRCDMPCVDTAAFCVNCQSELLHRAQEHDPIDSSVSPPPDTMTADLLSLVSSVDEQISITYAIQEPFQRDEPALQELSSSIPIPEVFASQRDGSGEPPHDHPLPRRIRAGLVTLAVVISLLLIVNGVLSWLSGIDQYSTVYIVDKSIKHQPTVLVTRTPVTGASTSLATSVDTSLSVKPALRVAPINLSFSATQGQANPPGQMITIANPGGAILNWQASIGSSTSSWLSISAVNGRLGAGQSTQIAVSVNTLGMELGSYNTQIMLTASGGTGIRIQGNPQTVAILLVVQAPCVLQVTPSRLTFSASLLQPNPPSQSISIKEGGNCVYPVSWVASVDNASATWLILSASSGVDSGDGSSITVSVKTQGILLGSYKAQVSFSATDGHGTLVQDSSQSSAVTLTVLG